jgi:hypothetical protein
MLQAPPHHESIEDLYILLLAELGDQIRSCALTVLVLVLDGLGPVSHGRTVSFTGIRNNQILVFVY